MTTDEAVREAAEVLFTLGDDVITFKIHEDDGEWYAFVSRPGYPGHETDYFATPAAAIAFVMETWPDAIQEK